MDVWAQNGAAALRYRDTTSQRQETERRQAVEAVDVVDVPEQVEARAQRLAEMGYVSAERVLALLPREREVRGNLLLERIIDSTSEFQAVNFLTRGARAVRSVGRISENRGGRLLPTGTGFLVSPRLLLTNNHVLPDGDTAARFLVEFNCEIDLDYQAGTAASYHFDPGTLFLTDEHLDFTLVALHPGADGKHAGEEFGWNQLISQQGKIVTGERVNIAGHPMGRLKEIAIRSNSLRNQLDDFLHYDTDTEPGNSGSPVFNDQWEVVALHHAGVPSTDAEGNWLKPDGTRWHPDDGDGAVEWVANEGTRVSVLLRSIEQAPLTDQQRALIAEVTGRTAVVSGPAAAIPLSPERPEATPTAHDRRAEATRDGARARRPPRGGDTHLVFLHGRGQAGKDPRVLRSRWTAGLAKGLALAGLPAIEAADAWFPFYGDALDHAISARESIAAAVPGADTAALYAPAGASARSLYGALLEEAARDAGMPAEAVHADDATADEGILGRLVGTLQTPLSWLANRSGLDERVIALVFRDVAAYLDRDAVRDSVLGAVRGTLPDSGRMVLVSHSLGTVVAMDLLTVLPDDLEVVHLVTAGSPLGMDSVFKRLLCGGPTRPERVATWVNAWCAADAVAIGCPLTDDWGSGVREIITNNNTDRPHDIEEYLADARVARGIGQALALSR